VKQSLLKNPASDVRPVRQDIAIPLRVQEENVLPDGPKLNPQVELFSAMHKPAEFVRASVRY